MDARQAHQLDLLLEVQSGVVSREQVIGLGLTDADVRRLARRREWARVHPGVYVNHTGPLTWRQRAWAAVLCCAPAALCDESAIRAVAGPGFRRHLEGGAIHVAIDHSRKVVAPGGAVVHRVVGLEEMVLWNTSPPRMRLEHATVRVAARAERDIDAIAWIADAVGARLTLRDRLAAAATGISRLPRRPFLVSVIGDVTTGTCSTLEHGYLTRVERPHGLPTAQRQFRESAKGPLYRDAAYEELGVIVELDGRTFHSKSRRHDADLERDLDAATSGRTTIRLGWGQVFDRGCSTAFKVGSVLQDHGWAGEVRRCPSCPPALPFVA